MGVCGLAGLGGGLSELDGVSLLLTVNLEPAPDHGKFSGLGGACIALRVDEEGVWVEFAKVTVLPGEHESLGEGDGGVEDWDSDDSCLCEVEGSLSSLYTSRVIILLRLSISIKSA